MVVSDTLHRRSLLKNLVNPNTEKISWKKKKNIQEFVRDSRFVECARSQCFKVDHKSRAWAEMGCHIPCVASDNTRSVLPGLKEYLFEG